MNDRSERAQGSDGLTRLVRASATHLAAEQAHLLCGAESAIRDCAADACARGLGLLVRPSAEHQAPSVLPMVLDELAAAASLRRDVRERLRSPTPPGYLRIVLKTEHGAVALLAQMASKEQG